MAEFADVWRHLCWCCPPTPQLAGRNPGETIVKRSVIPALVLLSTLGFAPEASAAAFTLDSYSVTSNQVDPGLRLVVTPVVPLGGDFTTPDLQVGDSYTFTLFHLAADEGSIEPDDYASK